jgi:hypothetical protein
MKRKALLLVAGLVLVLLPFNAFAGMQCQGGSLADSGCGYQICMAGGDQCEYCVVGPQMY